MKALILIICFIIPLVVHSQKSSYSKNIHNKESLAQLNGKEEKVFSIHSLVYKEDIVHSSKLKALKTHHIQDFKDEAFRIVSALSKYIKILTNELNSQEQKNEALNLALDLFINDQCVFITNNYDTINIVDYLTILKDKPVKQNDGILNLFDIKQSKKFKNSRNTFFFEYKQTYQTIDVDFPLNVSKYEKKIILAHIANIGYFLHTTPENGMPTRLGNILSY